MSFMYIGCIILDWYGGNEDDCGKGSGRIAIEILPLGVR